MNWDTALKAFCDQFKTIQAKHGPESVAFLSTGQIPCEEMAMLGSLAKFGMGLVHGDGNTRQCMATAVVSYKQAFGFDAPPYTYKDFEESDTIVLVGSNLCIAHPIMWERVLRNRHDPTIIAIDPRKTETAMAANWHIPLKPKSDLAFFYGVAHVLIRENWIDHNFIDQHTDGFEPFAQQVSAFTPEVAAEASGLMASDIERLARMIHEGKRVSFWWTMGVNQGHEAVRTAQALINLALMTGNIGKPGTGANSITGQCNAMGSRLFSNTTNLLGGHDFKNAEHRDKIAKILEIDAARIPDRDSLAYDQIMEGIVQGRIKGLWVIATNTAHSWINQRHARAVLDRLDFLVVQDMYHTTETAQAAHLVLPAAGWGEKEGCFINSERRIGLLKKVAKAPGEALTDFAICKLIAHYWGCDDLFKKWDSPEAVFKTLQKISEGQPCDISGIEGYEHLDRVGGVQWPYPANRTEAHEAVERRLFEDGQFHHPNGKARFMHEAPRPMPEMPSESWPIVMLTGRGTASQWHTQTRTAKSAVLRKLYPAGIYAEVNPEDARRYGITHELPMRVESRCGKIEVKAHVTPTVRPGQIFIPMHYELTNTLTLDAFDPYSRQPSYKASVVRIGPARLES